MFQFAKASLSHSVDCDLRQGVERLNPAWGCFLQGKNSEYKVIMDPL